MQTLPDIVSQVEGCVCAPAVRCLCAARLSVRLMLTLLVVRGSVCLLTVWETHSSFCFSPPATADLV